MLHFLHFLVIHRLSPTPVWDSLMQKILHFFASIYISLNYGWNVAHCVCPALISAHMAQLPTIFGAYRIPPESYPRVVGILPIHAQGV